jgi:integrase/recombinase XerD
VQIAVQMIKKQASVGIALDTRAEKADGTYPVKLRVIYKSKQNRMYGTIYSLTKDEYDQLRTSATKRLKEIRNNLSALETHARDIISQLPEFSFEAFRYKMFGKSASTSDPQDVYGAFREQIKDMERHNQIGNANVYVCALTSLQKYRPKLKFEQVSVKFLKDYETAMIAQGNGLTTVSMYLRCLRSIYNKAILAGIVSRDLYPFGSAKQPGKYCIPAPQNIKKALLLTDIKKIFQYIPTTDNEAFYRDLWIFSYLCNGANMKDICLLKYQNIDGDTITFRRAKTVNTNRKARPIVAAYTDKLRDIVTRWGNTTKAPGAYVFPILQPADDEKRIKERVAQVVKLTNKYIKRVAEATGIDANITTYTARHSFATTLRDAGVNVSFISESMGHTDTKTTENYLASIKDNRRNEIASKLTDF